MGTDNTAASSPIRTCPWLRRFIRHVDDERLERYGEREIADFLTELALTGHVVAGTQNQAISSLTLYYEKVLGR